MHWSWNDFLDVIPGILTVLAVLVHPALVAVGLITFFCYEIIEQRNIGGYAHEDIFKFGLGAFTTMAVLIGLKMATGG